MLSGSSTCSSPLTGKPLSGSTVSHQRTFLGKNHFLLQFIITLSTQHSVKRINLNYKQSLLILICFLIEFKSLLTNGLFYGHFQLLFLLCQLCMKLPHQLFQCGIVLQLKIFLLLSEYQKYEELTAVIQQTSCKELPGLHDSVYSMTSAISTTFKGACIHMHVCVRVRLQAQKTSGRVSKL